MVKKRHLVRTLLRQEEKGKRKKNERDKKCSFHPQTKKITPQEMSYIGQMALFEVLHLNKIDENYLQAYGDKTVTWNFGI